MTLPQVVVLKPDRNGNENWGDHAYTQSGKNLEVEPQTCGVGSFSPQWIQPYATKKVFVLVFTLLGVVQGMCWSYFTGTLSTLEKRFKMSSQTAGIVMSGTDISQLLFAVIVAHYGSRAHRTRWIAIGVFINALSCFLLASPQYFYGSGDDALALTEEYSFIRENIDLENTTKAQGFPLENSTHDHKMNRVLLCNKLKDPNIVKSLDGETAFAPLVLIFVSQFIHGIGGLMFYTLGGPYLDDNTKRKNVAMLFGITMSLRLLGPTFGFLIASGTLKMYINPLLTPTVDHEDPRWIGAWWLGWVLIGALMLAFAFLMALFPRKLKRQRADDAKTASEPDVKPIPKLEEIPRILKILLKNKINVTNNLSGIFFVFSAMGYWTYLPMYMENIFLQSASSASIISGVIGIVSQGSGLLLSGYLISRYHFSARKLAGWNTITGFIHMVVMLSFIKLGCEGGNYSLGEKKSDGTFDLITPCNQGSCHAGCETHEDGVFRNCSCLPDLKQTVVPGNCAVDCGHVFMTFLVINAIIKFVDSTGRIGNMLISYRCVKDDERSLSIALHMTLLCAFAFMPAPIVFGRIMDSVCLVWGKGASGGSGNCMLYNGTELRYVFNAFAAALVSFAVVFDFLVWYYVKDLDLYKESDNGEHEKLIDAPKCE